MNRDQLRSKLIQFKGGLKKRVGKMTSNRTLQVKEDFDRFVGRRQEQDASRKAHPSGLANDGQLGATGGHGLF
jgi:uncharacterized protein YjbJ (UPF0337 family)